MTEDEKTELEPDIEIASSSCFHISGEKIKGLYKYLRSMGASPQRALTETIRTTTIIENELNK
jgi:hypothetical protein